MSAFDPDELVEWAERYGHPEEWAKKAQQLHADNERLRAKLEERTGLHHGAGWTKPVSPPDPTFRPPGLPPKLKSTVLLSDEDELRDFDPAQEGGGGPCERCGARFEPWVYDRHCYSCRVDAHDAGPASSA